MNDEKIQRRLDRIDAKITALYDLFANKVNKPVWVGPKKIITLTGWTAWQLHEARQKSRISFRKNSKGGYEYDLSSLDQKLLLPQKVA